MKKALILLAFALSVSTCAVTAQTTTKSKTESDHSKTKVKPTTTIGDKIHNVTHKSKRTHGKKFKHKNKDTGKKTKVEVGKS